ncbi:phage tail assembly protein [Rhodospira trueperi]|uniref:Phage tail assembly chaperone protein, E, or 41 or 14 n=1 Tax=Rhodospira trueperi TaxID=69960 RepID=A0A1G7D511_9PROT|nr:phage tail assembly protein [Rhodospira trueperi]SDE45795.1 Phage tail assembly chaperone protein, E, or 41 or 14 [Rhodospira trueperi]
MNEFRSVKLYQPLPVGGDKTLDTLRFRAPKAGDLRGLKLALLEEAEVDAVLTLAPRISMDAVSAAHLAELHPADLLALTAEVLSFFAPPGTGAGAMGRDSPTTPGPHGVS